MEDEIWSKITTSLEIGKKLDLLYMPKNAQAFVAEQINSDYIKIKFENSKRYLILDKSRFISAWKYLNDNKGNWIKIGSSRRYTKPNTLEGTIKKNFNNDMNGLATATWIATILFKIFRNLEFNGKARNQSIRLIK